MSYKFTDLMVDLETLDTKPSAIILQIGWTFFNINGDRRHRNWGWHPNIDEQKELGATSSIDTQSWWMENAPEGWKRQVIADRQGLSEVFHEMTQVWEGCADENTRVWAKGTHFDLPILKKFFPEPWGFRNIHDLRTLKLIGTLFDFEWDVKNEDAHNAVSDAEHQAKEAQVIWNVLQSKR